MKWLYLLFAFAYLVSPYDILPDFMGLPGRLDDIAVLVYVYIKFFRNASPQPKDDTIEAEFSRVEKPRVKSPFEVLELSPQANKEEIEAQYRKLMSQYHPDKVNHLGPELQKTAHQKTLEIKAAYEKLVGK